MNAQPRENVAIKRPVCRRLARRFPRTVLLALSLLVAVALIAASACGGSNSPPKSNSATGFTVTDDLGKTFSFDGPVDSIISLAPANTEIVFALGAGNKLIGRTDYCNYPPEAASVESVGGFWDPNKEKIVVLNPDVVLAADIHNLTGDTAWLGEKGLKVITVNPQTLNDILTDISMVGKLTGKEEKAEELVADMQSRIDYVAQQTAGLSGNQKPRVLHVTWHDPLWTVGKGSFVDALIEIAGGVNIFHGVSGDVQVDLETAVTRNPEVITVFTGHGDAANQSYAYVIASGSPFKTTDAYTNPNGKRIYLIDADLASRYGPRIVEALEIYARVIHPEIFGPP
ncbi:MAG: cobalamin-binding protein [Chloroflexi bacterium]|nr:cobalamin-binding protein [Chloroflexota bacterium]